MGLFQYSAIDKAGKESTGTIIADNEKLARHKLRNEGLIPVEVYIISKKVESDKKHKFIDKKIKLLDLSSFTRELSTLINAGLEIEQSVSALAEQTENKYLKQIISAIHAKILEGYSLSNALNEYPRAFPKIYRATVHAGEEAGHLGEVLYHLAEYLDSQEQMRQRVVQAIIYPCILTLMCCGIVAFLLVYVTPKIIEIFENSTQTLPLSTRILLAISNTIQNKGLFILITIVLLVFFMRRALKNEKIKEAYDYYLLRMPVLGKTIQLIETSRFLRTFAILTQATVPILQALSTASQLIDSIPVRKEILEAKDRIKDGSSIYAALKKSKYLTKTSLQFIASGESSGNLEEMLIRAANNQDRNVQFSLNSLLTILEPVLILLMGVIVLFIVLATLLPIFQLSTMIS